MVPPSYRTFLTILFDHSKNMLLFYLRARKFRKIGYHFYIRHDGTMTKHSILLEVGAHAVPYNHCSIGICYED